MPQREQRNVIAIRQRRLTTQILGPVVAVFVVVTTAASADASAAASEELNTQAETAMAVVRQLETLVGGDVSAALSRKAAPPRVTRPALGTVVKMVARPVRTAQDEPLGDTGTYGGF